MQVGVCKIFNTTLELPHHELCLCVPQPLLLVYSNEVPSLSKLSAIISPLQTPFASTLPGEMLSRFPDVIYAFRGCEVACHQERIGSHHTSSQVGEMLSRFPDVMHLGGVKLLVTERELGSHRGKFLIRNSDQNGPMHGIS